VKVTIWKTRMKPVEAEIPLACPKCREVFVGQDADEAELLASVVTTADRRAALAPLDGTPDGEHEIVYGVVTDGSEAESTFALSCGACGKVLATQGGPKAAPSTGATVPVDLLSVDERNLLCGAITRFGTGDHPEPDSETLPHMSATYALQCVNDALRGQAAHLNTEGKEIARRLRTVLMATVHGEESSWR
jgi:hypothetical protein